MFINDKSTRSLCTLFVSIAFHAIGLSSGCKPYPIFQTGDISGPLVTTNSGPVVGKFIQVLDTNVAAFLGIPYAEPPVGELRFTKPRPVEVWNENLFAHNKPPPCMQHVNPKSFLKFEKNPTEDCLFLNIWTPTQCSVEDRLPVMIYIHGGAFHQGSSGMALYDGRILAASGEVVIVTMNYRLGPFGFLNVGKEDAPGNVGLSDQALAMKWVKDNIGNFGGNPDKITLFGESAGSQSVSLHLVSPASRNLFQRVILQSGTMYHPQMTDSVDRARIKANTFAERVNCANDSVNLFTDEAVVIQCLKMRDPVILCEEEHKFRFHTFAFFLPSLGNDFLPKSPIESYESGDIAPVEALIGLTREEGTMFLHMKLPKLFSFFDDPDLTLGDIKKALPALFQDLTEDVRNEIYDFYFQNMTAEDPEIITSMLQYAVGDYLLNCPTLFLAEKLNHAYMYWMTHSTEWTQFADWVGVHHGVDLTYVFGRTLLDTSHLSTEDDRFSKDTIQKWTTFARSGYPLNDESRTGWPKFSAAQANAYELSDAKYENIRFPRQEACVFWRSVLDSLVEK